MSRSLSWANGNGPALYKHSGVHPFQSETENTTEWHLTVVYLHKSTMSFHFHCYYPAEKPRFFTVKIHPQDTVFDLATKVREVLESAYRLQLTYDEIQLFKADLPKEPRADRHTRALQWRHQQKEDTHLKDDSIVLSSLFPGGPSSLDVIHIIVSDPEVSELGESFGDPLFYQYKKLRQDLGNRLDSLRPVSSPSEIIGSVTKMRELLEGVSTCIYLGRPSGAPAAIFNPALATLQHRLDHLDHVNVTRQDVMHAADYLNHAIGFYSDETGREKALQGLLDVAVDQGGSWNKQLSWADGIKPDCCWWHKEFLTTVLELKNTVGLAGNPVLQAIVDYSKIISQEKYKSFREFCNFPTVLLGVAENRIDISIAVCIGDIHVTKLLTLDATSGFLASDNIVRLARVFVALSSCRKDLTLYYDEIEQRKGPKLSSLFPQPTPADPSNSLPALAYKQFLSRAGEPASALVGLGNTNTAMYIATLDGTEKEVVVKFTARYNEKAHHILADAGFAPKLHFCGRVVGGLYMVVMDRVDAKSLWQLQTDKMPIPTVVLEHVRQAVHLLHQHNIVFGDLRDPNILYDASKNGAVLVDFDWPGEDGVSRYPPTLNLTNEWPEEVVPYGIMHKAHDLWQLERIKDVYQRGA